MSNIIRRKPTSGQVTFDDFDSMFEDLWRSFTLPTTTRSMPGADIYSEDDKHVVIELSAPGFKQDDIEISIRNGMLEISGERSEKEKQDNKRSYVVRESSTSFARHVMLPDGVDVDNIAAELENGVLKVTLPIERPEAKRVKISSPRQSGGAKKLSATSENK